MSKQSSAAKAIKFGIKRGYTPDQIATLLDMFNLLAEGLPEPDLPEANDPSIFVPDGKGWLPCGLTGPSVWTAPGGRIMVQRVEPGDLTPAEARFFALAVLAAAKYAEGAQSNGNV